MENSAEGKRPLVSVHGGHSGQFCGHAVDTLEEIVAEYHRQGFAWVGLTEHMPPAADRFRYVEEEQAGLRAADLRARFDLYIKTARRIQDEYRGKMAVRVAFETECHTGAIDLARDLVQEYRPDYVVGSVHHVHDRMIDFSPELYLEAARECGGVDALYCAYFDQQYELLSALRPGVVGHFDLVRIFDPGYVERLGKPAIWSRIERNLHLVAEYGGVLDLNVRALLKGAQEPYVSRRILARALELGIAVCPGDDSHGVASVGKHILDGIRILDALGAPDEWRLPE